jgi:hypothetical protein
LFGRNLSLRLGKNDRIDPNKRKYLVKQMIQMEMMLPIMFKPSNRRLYKTSILNISLYRRLTIIFFKKRRKMINKPS